MGNNAGLRNTDASENTFIGAGAGEENTTGNQNTFLGVISGSLNLSGSRLTLLGYNSNTSVDGLTNATAIGHDAVVSNSNRMVLGVSGTDIQFDGALMPNNDAGLAGQVLTSAGPGATPTWGTASGSGWSLLGNASTNPTTNFIGTTDDVALEVRVNNTRVSRLEIDTSPFTAGTLIPNIISGHVDNRVTDGVKGAVISGGGDTNPNTADGDWAAVGGGRDNHAGSLSPYAAYATIGGGASNVATGQWSTIPGGKNVTVTGRGAYANGIRTNSESLGLTVVGTSNELLAGLDTDNWVETDPVFIVGNGEVNTAGNIVDRTNAMTVLKNGNVGIGTSAPNTILEVSSGGTTTSRLTSTSGDVALELFRTGNSNVDYRFFSDGNDDFLKLQYSGNDFGTNNDALFISDVGDLGVGISPSTSLHVRHPGGISTSSLGEGISLSNGTRSSRWTITHEYNSIGTLEDFQFSYNGSLVAQINQSGAYSQVSDLRLKENIKNINGVLGQLMKLRPVTYQFRKDTDHREKIGFIAQEVKELFPTLVNGSGKIINGEIDYFSLDYANMSVINVKAIQEQQKIIEKQGREIELLKEKLTTKEKDSAEIKSELETLKAQVDALSNLIKAEAKND